MNNRIMAAMSGGVDSSVTAALLLDQGYDVCGATLRLYTDDGDADKEKDCSTSDDAYDARQVACRLGIDHYIFNFSDAFREKVICKFADDYIKGLTPNPCIECNRNIKFSRLIERAKLLGYDMIATGHYVKREYDSASGRYLLKKAEDSTKDQTYVLYVLSQYELERTLFPMGDITKAQARKIAEEKKLINAKKRDSQDICFVPDGDYAGFLENTLGVKSKQGEFVYKDGAVLGKHKGIIHYTVGQRKGLGISYAHPIYVLGKNPETGVVTLGENEDLFTNRLYADNVNFIAIEKLNSPMRVSAKARYSQRESAATVHPIDDNKIMVEFDEPQRAITPGQAVVMYSNDVVIGGGTIIPQETEKQ